uniref:Uncharacterized protein n=1 Tax=Chrysotila carterae TaxID=13221 RepID=A0A7S4BIE3_CHRCT|mmetsp:Transcript_17847/g.34807  ORF Transcript_17847/g.34807 Transcript_17847/m.34807 type:complete len:346 (+) Transcript_17847:543-1580(+)
MLVSLRHLPIRDLRTRGLRLCHGETQGNTSASSPPVTASEGGFWGLFNRYQAQMLESPLRTNAATSALLCLLGDALSQAVEWKMRIMSPEKEGYNYSRTVRMTAYGMLAGPLYAMWFRTLDVTCKAVSVTYQPVLSGKLASFLESSTTLSSLLQRSPVLQWASSLHKEQALSYSPARILAAKVVADSLLASPLMLHAYFVSIGMLEGRAWNDILEMAQVNFHRAWGLSLVVWTPVQLLNFHFVPVHFQAAFVSMVNVGWKMTLSLINHYHDYGTPELRSSHNASTAELRRLRQKCLELEATNEELRRRLGEGKVSDATWQMKYSPITQAAKHYAAKQDGAVRHDH